MIYSTKIYKANQLLSSYIVHPAHGISISIKELLKIFDRNLIDASLCGGAVRDILLERTFKDIDIVVKLPIEEIKNLLISEFGKECICEYYPKFGVIKIGLNQTSIIDFAMYRSADDIGKHKKLDDVIYRCGNTLVADAQNRDVTINCAYWNYQDKFLDPLGCAFSDITARRIVVAADPRKCRIDPRLSFRILLFSQRGFYLSENAREYLNLNLEKDILRYDRAKLPQYINELTRNDASLKSAILHAGLPYLKDNAVVNLLKSLCNVS